MEEGETRGASRSKRKYRHNPAAQGETAIDPPSASPSPRHASCSSSRSCSSNRSCRSCSSNRSCSSSRSCSSGRCLPFYSPGLAPRLFEFQGGGNTQEKARGGREKKGERRKREAIRKKRASGRLKVVVFSIPWANFCRTGNLFTLPTACDAPAPLLLALL